MGRALDNAMLNVGLKTVAKGMNSFLRVTRDYFIIDALDRGPLGSRIPYRRHY